MTFEMTITKRKPTAEGKEEHIVRIKNSRAIENSNDLLNIIRLALDNSVEYPSVTQENQTEPAVALLHSEFAPPVLKEEKRVQPPPAPPVKKEKQVSPMSSRPKQVELIGSNPTGFTIAEMLKVHAESPKEKILAAEKIPFLEKEVEVIDRDPKRRIKIWVNCPECEYEGAKGADLGRKYFFCPNTECRTKLHVIDATDEHGAKDDKGYVRLAQDRFLTREELFNQYQNAQEN